MADSCPTIILVTAADGGNRFVNRAYREFFGVTNEQVEGGKWQPLLHPDDGPEYVGALLGAVRGHAPFRAEARVRRADGEWRWIAAYAEPRFSPSGEFLGHTGICHDITERKQAERALRESEKMYRAIGESIDYGVWVCAPDGRNTYASESFLKLVGQTQEQCSNFGWGDVLHPDDVERTLAAWKECVRTEGLWDIEHRFRGADGEWHPVLARGVPVRDEQGRIVRWAGINLDIGALKRAQESLRESEAKYRTLFENMAEEVHFWRLVRDEDGRIRTWRLVDANPSALKTWGKKFDDIKGKTADEIFGPGPTDHYMPVVQKIMAEGAPCSYEDYFPNLDRHFRFTSVPLGEYFITTGADITEHKRAEAAPPGRPEAGEPRIAGGRRRPRLQQPAGRRDRQRQPGPGYAPARSPGRRTAGRSPQDRRAGRSPDPADAGLLGQGQVPGGAA